MSARILVIDTDDQILLEMEQHLSAQGYTVATAAGGDEGLRRFREFVPELVITEILMPDTDGIECLLQIKRISPKTKVLAVSAGEGRLASKFFLDIARKLGADDALKKPFTREQLLDAVHSVLSAPSATNGGQAG
jgi:DNA-binding response OmpR family regulator